VQSLLSAAVVAAMVAESSTHGMFPWDIRLWQDLWSFTQVVQQDFNSQLQMT
jgi:hypothetical protein